MKVLHLIDSGGLYGAEKMLLALVQEQMKQGIEPMILSAGALGVETKSLESEAERRGLPLTTWRMRPGLNFYQTLRILSWAKKNGYSILHSHGFKFNILLGFLPKFIRRLSLVSTVHGYTVLPGLTKMGIYYLVDRISLRLHDSVVFVSQTMGKDSGNQPVLRRSTVIFNGISGYEESDIRQKYGQDLQRYTPFILFVGRLSREKGADVLIKAFLKIRDHKNVSLVIVGDGPESASLKSLAQHLGVLDHIHFVGYQDDIENFMRSGEALVIPSRMEGLPITLLEGMKYQIPIIATSVGGVGSVLANGHLGRLVEPENSTDLALAILEVIGDQGYQKKLVEQAYKEFENNYTANKMAEQYYCVYEGL